MTLEEELLLDRRTDEEDITPIMIRKQESTGTRRTVSCSSSSFSDMQNGQEINDCKDPPQCCNKERDTKDQIFICATSL